MTKWSKEFKEEALKLSDEIRVKKAASQLKVLYHLEIRSFGCLNAVMRCSGFL